MRKELRALLAGALTIVIGAAANAADDGIAVPASLQRIVGDFTGHADAAQGKQVAEAATASPGLGRRLGALAESGKLTGFALIPGPVQPGTPFASTIDRGRIVFTSDFLNGVAKKRIFDVARPDDILPDNLTFALGALSFHLQQAGAPKPPPLDMASFMKASMERDARAFIQGWNDVVDAATHENKGQPLNANQVAALLLNLRYRALFLAEGARPSLTPSGAIEPNDENVGKIVSALGRMRLLDFGVPPFP